MYTDEKNPLSYPALIAAKYNGVTVDVPAFKLGDEKKPEHAAKNPRGKIPALETTAGVITGPDAIARYGNFYC